MRHIIQESGRRSITDIDLHAVLLSLCVSPFVWPAEWRLSPLDVPLQGKQLKLYSVMPPHMLSFWVNVAAFFTRCGRLEECSAAWLVHTATA